MNMKCQPQVECANAFIDVVYEQLRSECINASREHKYSQRCEVFAIHILVAKTIFGIFYDQFLSNLGVQYLQKHLHKLLLYAIACLLIQKLSNLWFVFYFHPAS